MKATVEGGALALLPKDKWYINVPGAARVLFNNLPIVSDSKGAAYRDETIPGRSLPTKTFVQGENRTIGVRIRFVILTERDKADVPLYVQSLKSATYSRESNVVPVDPPPICQLRFGNLLSGQELCAVLTNYSVSYPDDVAWVPDIDLPCRFEMETSWQVVYASNNLPGQFKILEDL